MMELIAPAASPEAVVAAVQGGAGAVCITPLGLDEPEKFSGGFTAQSFATSVAYCHVRGIRAYLELEGIPADEDFEKYEKIIRLACRSGMNAIILSDLGLLRFVQQVAPGMPVHAGRKLCTHNLAGINFADQCGFKRVVLARELSKKNIEYMLKSAPDIETALSVHGLSCMAYGGRCSMSIMLGQDPSAFDCDERCRMKYGYGSQANEYPLALKELCLLEKLPEIGEMGLDAVRIEYNDPRPEYVAAVTGIYERALTGGKEPKEDIETLEMISGWGGLSEGCYSGETGPAVLGEPTESEEREAHFKNVKHVYRHRERECIEVRFYALVRAGEPAMIAVQDSEGRIFRGAGPVPERVENDKGLFSAQMRTQLYKLTDTPYTCTAAKVHVQPGLWLSTEQIKDMRDSVLERLGEARSETVSKEEGAAVQTLRYANRKERPCFTVSISKASQLSQEFLSLRPELIYVPAEEILAERDMMETFIKSEETQISVMLPPVFTDSELPELREQLLEIYGMGVRQALISHPCHIELARSCGFGKIRADQSFNIRNSYTLKEMKQLGLESATVSYALSAQQIRALSKAVDTEMIVYGRIPLMLTESCIIKNSSGRCNCESPHHIVDENANVYPVIKTFGCRNFVLSAKKLYLGDRISRFFKLGLWGARLCFTTENSRECVQVMESYMAAGKYEPNDYDMGLYFPGEQPGKTEKKKLFGGKNGLFG